MLKLLPIEMLLLLLLEVELLVEDSRVLLHRHLPSVLSKMWSWGRLMLLWGPH